MGDTFLTIKSVSEGIFKDKGSKFLSFAFPVETVDEVKTIVQQKRTEFYDARHVCYAYMLGAERTTFRAVDDGEPSSTAGRPILGQINSCQLTNVLVIVVRYFGGILLGTSGLINAYKEAAAAAIENAQIEEKIVKSAIQVTFKYPQLNDIMRVVKEQDLEVSGQEFGFDENKMTLWVRNSQLNAVKEKIKQILI
ncbi:MAG: YigZ family protein [Paludibacteraceae bacterium]|jgi:uncharacterized YigZ family protein|nr:YigZ family protein [Paludibacteraceae bacterium]MBO7724404.1 YigZ family protein [Paludibacteraceae bacterium]